MEKFIEFREKLKKKGLCDTSLDILVKRFLLCFVVLILLLIPRPGMDEILGWMGIGFMLVGVVDLNVFPHLYIKQGNAKISIYKCLKETTICKKEYIKFGIKSHCRFIAKLLGISFILRLCIMFMFETFSVDYLLYILASFVIFLLLTTLSVAHEFYVATKD